MGQHRKPTSAGKKVLATGLAALVIGGGFKALSDVEVGRATVASSPEVADEAMEKDGLEESPAVLEKEGVAEAHGRERDAIPRKHYDALEAAQRSIDTMAFSEEGLRKQLKMKGYPRSAVNYAIENVTADYRAEAIESAESYLKAVPMSSDELRNQLDYEGFEPEHIENAVIVTYG